MLLVQILCVIVPMLLVVALFTLLERNIMGSMQRRAGPNVSGIFGLLQPIYDVTKLALKEPIKLSNADFSIYLIAPVVSLILSQVVWSTIPLTFHYSLTDSMLQALFLMAMSSISIYGIVLSGWSSNSKYAFLGACRSVAQMVSYELPMGILLICIFILNKNFSYNNTLNLIDLQHTQFNGWFFNALLPMSIIWLICILAETNRAPFDLPEAEAELVAGYNVEYGALGFALFFVAEYGNMLTMCFLTVIYLFGGALPVFSFLENFIPPFFHISFKVIFISIFYVWIRATLPRYRYDQLMHLGWKAILLISIVWISLQVIFYKILLLFI